MLLWSCITALNTWQDHAEPLLQGSQQHPDGQHRLSVGGSSTGTGVLIARDLRHPWYQIKTHNTPVRNISSPRKLWGKQKKRLFWFPGTMKWIQERFSINGVCAVTATALSFQQNWFNHGYTAGVVVRRCVQTWTQPGAATDGTETTLW